VETPWHERRPAPRALLTVAVVSAVLAALCIVAIDQPLARWLAGYEPSSFWDRSVEILEWTIGLPVFKFMSSFVLVIGMLVTLSVRRWRAHAPVWTLLAGTHVISRFVTNQIKDATGRLRPREWLANGGDTFLWDGGVAFPSGHVVLFASIVIPLAIVAPRTRPLLAIVAFMMAARVAVNAHFVSDVIGGVTLVALIAWLLGALLRPIRTA
jgi:membrane-associated phospholipid phosphatase